MGKVSPKKHDDDIEIIRKKYYLRHFTWSGIFPIQGGLISDPHFLQSLPQYFQGKISNFKINYQIYDVNPFFSDYSSEIVLVIKNEKDTYSYILDFSESTIFNSVQNSKPMAEFIEYEKKLAVFASAFDTAENKRHSGLFFIELPFETGVHVELHDSDSELYKELVYYLKREKKFILIKERFCKSRWKPLISFYNDNFGSCSD